MHPTDFERRTDSHYPFYQQKRLAPTSGLFFNQSSDIDGIVEGPRGDTYIFLIFCLHF